MTAKLPKPITSDFAILDVKNGRTALAKHFEDRPSIGECPENLRIPVVIYGYVENRWGRDDGTSIEFSVDVVRVENPDVLPSAK